MIAAADALHIPNVGPAHPDQKVVPAVVRADELPRRFPRAADPMIGPLLDGTDCFSIAQPVYQVEKTSEHVYAASFVYSFRFDAYLDSSAPAIQFFVSFLPENSGGRPSNFEGFSIDCTYPPVYNFPQRPEIRTA